jgi:hypothetical protein
MYGWMDGFTDCQMDGWVMGMDGWLAGWMDDGHGWLHEWMTVDGQLVG